MTTAVLRSGCRAVLACAALLPIPAAGGTGGIEPRGKPGRTPSHEEFRTAPAPVHVFVKKGMHAGHIVYRYRLVNGSEHPIASLIVGLNYYLGESQIRMSDDAVPTGRETSPRDWSFHLYPTEEDTVGYIAWEIDSTKDGLPGGASLSGFSVEVSSPETAYERGRWVVYLNSAQQTYYEGVLESDSRSPSAPGSNSRRKRPK